MFIKITNPNPSSYKLSWLETVSLNLWKVKPELHRGGNDFYKVQRAQILWVDFGQRKIVEIILQLCLVLSAAYCPVYN